MSQKNNNPADCTKRAEEIYFAAMELESPEERRAYVRNACAGNAAVQQKVTSLFNLQDRGTAFFDQLNTTQISAGEIINVMTEIPEFFTQMKTVLPDDDEVGKQIGNYKLLQKIGEGGAGNVYLAEQLHPVRRQVALKIIKLGMDTKSVIARFEAERQALAMMEHPNIAHVLNAGETETGRPYFVMELVCGESIITYCVEQELDVSQRLKLFARVCMAVQHAHQKGIIHRDIKPSNVLITQHDGTASPMLIDFGIAKATADDLLTDKTVLTSMGFFIGTPTYMSPEQADRSDEDIDTRSDIYSLGSLLYELLAGTTPFDQKTLMKNGAEEMRRILRHEEPLRPSARFRQQSAEVQKEIAAHCKTSPKRLEEMLTRELDWIVMKALEKERDRRYQTAESLAEDIMRYINDEPVSARPPSRYYRLSKTVRRNKGLFASVSAISVTLTMGLAMTSWLLVKEKALRDRAVQAEQKEMHLRKEAENRERITQAAYLITHGKLDEAEQTVDLITNTKPSTEAESVYRTLGEWHARNEKWNMAAKRFSMLLQVDVRNNSGAITSDLLMGGPVLIECGDIKGYEQFRLAAIERTHGTDDPIAAERTLKVSLLTPASEQVMKLLQPFSDVAEAATIGPVNDPMTSWRCVSLALMSYRSGNNAKAIEWGKKSQSYQENNPSRTATTLIIQSMAHYTEGSTDTATAELDAARKILDQGLASGFRQLSGRWGLWYDWLFARILLREAESLAQNISD